MRYFKIFKLKEDLPCLVRHLTTMDAESVIAHLKKTAKETDFLSRYPDEITMSVDEERQFLQSLSDSRDSILLGLFIECELLATAGFSPVGTCHRFGHRAVFSIAVQKERWGQGFGKRLIKICSNKAKAAGYEVLELSVAANNLRAIEMYRNADFEVYGTVKSGFRHRDGNYTDELLMSKRL